MSEVLICTSEIKDKTYELYESPEARPEIFVDAVQGIAVRGSTVKVNFVNDVIDYNSPNKDVQKRAIAFRLVMSLPVYIDTIEFLHKNAQEMKGLIKAQPESDQKPS